MSEKVKSLRTFVARSIGHGITSPGCTWEYEKLSRVTAHSPAQHNTVPVTRFYQQLNWILLLLTPAVWSERGTVFILFIGC